MAPSLQGPRIYTTICDITSFSTDGDEVLSLLEGVESDRLRVAILVGATSDKPDIEQVRDLVRLAAYDYRDVLMVEYTKAIDYKGALRRLGLVRPYPI